MPNRCLSFDEQEQISEQLLEKGHTFSEIISAIEDKNFQLGCEKEIEKRKKKNSVADEQDLDVVTKWIDTIDKYN